ncbi:PREDICTED: uncharacterized protein LOC108568019 [Nicrophorus vespilloides]|uniref:Uncharacterized protein LOC108568019 n=1 Tax=Nicrophorus vespilloides TaxID=110193 RepID=A0ABM1NC03_NICVS|nr:PREDICTED: uncharacterized protein LOC108568019 [Nicrophorus vespilloides]
MENTLIPQLRTIKCNLINLSQTTPFPVVVCETQENFDEEIAENLLYDCENLIEQIEFRQCGLLNRHSKVLENFASKISEMKDLRCSENIEVDKFVKKVVDSTNIMDSLLPNLKMDIEYLWQRQLYISKYISDTHKFIRSKDESLWKKVATVNLRYCYNVGYIKYRQLDNNLDEIQYALKTSLQMLIRSIDIIENAINYIRRIDECMLQSKCYVQEYLTFNVKPNSTIELILMRSLDKGNCLERRSFCLKELIDLKKERVQIGRCLSKLYDFVLSFHGDFWFFESLRLFNALEILYNNDMKLHSIESKIKKVLKKS